MSEASDLVYIAGSAIDPFVHTQLLARATRMGLTQATSAQEAGAAWGQLWVIAPLVTNAGTCVDPALYHKALPQDCAARIVIATAADWRLTLAQEEAQLRAQARRNGPLGVVIPRAADIKGLLRFGSAIVANGVPGVVLDVAPNYLEIYVRGGYERFFYDDPKHPDKLLQLAQIGLDLRDPTSCAHAAWWLGEGTQDLTPEEQRLRAMCRHGAILDLEQQARLLALVLRFVALRGMPVETQGGAT